MSQARAGDKTGKISDAGLAFPAQDPHHPGPLLPTTPSPLPGEEGEQPCSPPHGPADLKPSHGVCRPTPGTTHPACVGTTWTFLPTRVHTGWHARFQRRRPSHHPGYPPAPPVPNGGRYFLATPGLVRGSAETGELVVARRGRRTAFGGVAGTAALRGAGVLG